jgi:hypothetical protein
MQTTLSVVVALLCFYKFRKRNAYIQLIGLVFFISFAANASAYILFDLGFRKSTNIPQSAYDLLVLPLFSLVFYHALGKRFGKVFLIISVVVVAFSLFNLMGVQKEGINSYNKFINSFVITCYCVFYFYRLMVELPATHLQRMPMFWFTSGFLIYHAGTIFLFAFTTYLTSVMKDDLTTYWSFHNLLSVIEHVIIVTGAFYDLSLLPKQVPESRSGKNL